MAGLFVVSSMPDPPVPSGVSDVALHGLAYFGLTLVIIRAVCDNRWSHVSRGTLSAAWLIAVAYGVTDEWHQSFVHARSAELRDVRSDAIGALGAVVFVGAWGIIRPSS
jgi:VanZ family protein